MSESEHLESHNDFPWAVVFATAAVGTLAFVLYKKLQAAGGISTKSVESALDLCSKAASALDNRLNDPSDFSMAG